MSEPDGFVIKIIFRTVSALQLSKVPAHSRIYILQIPLLTTSCNCRIAQNMDEVQDFS